jgi:hypothetical protein
MPHAGEIRSKSCAAEFFERSLRRPTCGFSHGLLEPRQHALAVGLPQRNQARSGRYPVAGHRVQESVDSRLQRNAVGRADDTDRDRIHDDAAATLNQPIERRNIPCGAGDIDKRPALHRGFQAAFARRHQCTSKFRYFAERRIIAGRRGTMRLGQKYAITKPGPNPQHGIKPRLEG